MAYSSIRVLCPPIASIVLAACQSSAPITPPVSAASPRHAEAAPILQSVDLRTNVSNGIGTISVVPYFHFIAPNGNAIVLRREIVDTDGAISQTQIGSATINIPAEAQKKGAVISGGW